MRLPKYVGDPPKPSARKTGTGYAPVILHDMGYMRTRSETLGSDRYLDDDGQVQYGNRALRFATRSEAVQYARHTIQHRR